MTEALVVSNLVLWVLVVALAVVVVALTRQIGVLHERIAPVGALAVERGPKVGEPVPLLSLPSLAGEDVSLGAGGDAPARTLLFFLSPTCPVCKTLLPTLQRIAREEGEALRVLYASDGSSERERREHETFARAHAIEPSDYLLSEDLGLHFAVSKLPHAVLWDEGGIVRAKGMVNTREHLESLFEAEELGVGSLQEYATRQASLEVVNGGAKR
jgi:methylamine dehydrogenase accessory protein MauD